MALVTSPTETIPDLNYEYHTITVDTIGQESANTFTCYLAQPLKNIVQARLTAARINSNASTEHCYISIKELDTILMIELLTYMKDNLILVCFVAPLRVLYPTETRL